MTLLRLASCLCLAAGCSPAQDRIVEQAYLEDPAGTLTYPAVASLPYTPYSGAFSRGQSASVFWVRLRLAPGQADAASTLPAGIPAVSVLRVQPAFLDEIELFDPAAPPGPPRITGNRYPVAASELPGLLHHFLLPVSGGPRYVYLRLRTETVKLMQVDLLSFRENEAEGHVRELICSLMIGFLTVLAAWGVFYWITAPDPLVRAFVVMQAGALCYAVFYFGYARCLAGAWMAPATMATVTKGVFAAMVPATVYFHYQFLSEYRPPRILMRLFASLIVAFPIAVLLLIAGYTRAAVTLNLTVAPWAVPLAVLLAATGTVWSRPELETLTVFRRRTLIGVYTALLFFNGLWLAQFIGWFPVDSILIIQPLFFGFANGAILPVAVHIRARRLAAARGEALTRLKLAEQQVAQERGHSQQQSEFLAMLTHELKTPLAVLRMVLGSATPSPAMRTRAIHSVADMQTVIERCSQADLLGAPETPLHRQRCVVAAELDALVCDRMPEGRVHLRVSDPSFQIQTDSDALRVIFSNLLENAVKYSEPHTRIEVAARPAEERNRSGIAVAFQNVPGVAGHPDPARVFCKYYRSPGAHRCSGTGLGLFLSASLATRLGGELRYVPDETHVRFELWLPA